MIDWIKRALAPPVFEDSEADHKHLVAEDKTRLAGPLNAILLTILGMTVGALVWQLASYSLPTGFDQWFNFLSGITITVMSLGLLFLLRRGYVTMVGTSLSSAIWLLTTLWIYSSGHLNAPAVTTYFLTITIAGLTLGGRTVIAFGLACLLAIVGGYYAQTSHILPTPYGVQHPYDVIVLASTVVTVTLLLHFTARSTAQAFEQARRNDEKLRQYRDHLEELVETRTAELQQANSLLASVNDELICANTELAREIAGRVQAEQTLQNTLEQVEQAKQEWEVTADSLPELVCLLDGQGRVLRTNRTMEDWGLGRVTEVKGQEVQALFDPAWADFWEQAWAEASQGRSAERQVEDERLKRHLHLQVQPILGQTKWQNRVTDSFAVAVIRDVTTQIQIEEALRQERNFAESLIETAQTVILVLDTQGRIVRFNPYLEEISGYRLEEVQGQDWFTTFLPERDWGWVRELFLKAIGDIQTCGNINPIVTSDGRERQIEWYDKTLKDAEGNVVGLLSTGQDVTRRLRAEQALQESEERYRTLFERTLNPILIIDTEGNYIAGNEASLQFLECTREELLAKNVRDFIPPGKEKQVLETHEPLWHSSGIVETEYYVHPNVKILELAITPMVSGGKQIIFGIGRDITAHKRAEQALRESEQRYRSLFERVPVGLYRTTPDGRILDANPALARMLGYDRESLLAANVIDIWVDPGERQRFRALAERDGTMRNFEMQLRRSDGTIIWVQDNTQVFRDAEGRVLYYEGSLEDFTARKQMEEALRESEQRYRSTFEQAAVGITHTSPKGHFISVNQHFCDIVGYNRDELLALAFQEITHPDDLEAEMEYSQQLLGGEIPTYSMRKRYIRKACPATPEEGSAERDISIVWVNMTVSLVREPSGEPKYFIAVVEDVTAQVRAEEQVKASLREKELLLQEIHHRVKNNLQIISSLLDLQAGVLQDERICQVLRESRNRVRSMARVHEQLYRSGDLAWIDMEDYVYDLASYLCRSYGAYSIALKIDVPDVSLDIDTAVPCGLIINELISNAMKHAFPPPLPSPPRAGGEEIRIVLRSLPGDGGKIELAVSDNGVGLPADLDLEDTPSLGLTLVNLLTRQLDGTLEMEVNEGTTFKITFSP